jgi:hypothetical protein
MVFPCSRSPTCASAITNELFLLVSATGAINFPNQAAYLANANTVWTWCKIRIRISPENKRLT